MGKIKVDGPKGFQVIKETGWTGNTEYVFSVDRKRRQVVTELDRSSAAFNVEEEVVRFGVQKLVEDLEEIIAAYKKDEGIV